MIETRPYDTGQSAAFLTLYRACLVHYNIAAATSEDEERILSLLASGRHMSCLMAFDGKVPVGFATWTLTFPAGAGLALYMKEIFVDRIARGRGVGRHLLAGLIEIAEAEGCVRFDWQTDGDNSAAQAFYASIDAPANPKISYRLTASEFRRFKTELLEKP